MGGIADLLLHSRYLAIRNEFIVDLISDQKFMTQQPQTGLKINFSEYTNEVCKAVTSITVKDLVTVLWKWTASLSSSSSVKDIIFLIQNLYTMGGFVVGTTIPIETGPLRPILDRAADEQLKKRLANNPKLRKAKRLKQSVEFRAPRFYLEPDLNQKQIRIQMQVNGQDEKMVMDYEEFYQKVLAASGSTKLHVGES